MIFENPVQKLVSLEKVRGHLAAQGAHNFALEGGNLYKFIPTFMTHRVGTIQVEVGTG
jgi:hypothetical protein